MTTARALPAALLLATLLPPRAAALPGNAAVSLELMAAGRGAPALALGAGCWLAGEVEAQARLAVAAAPRTGGRAAAGAVTPEAGLRWAPDVGRWRPLLGLAVGVRLPTAGRAGAPTGAAWAGLERRLGSGWALTAAAGLRLRAGERAAGEAALGVRLTP